MFYSVQNQCTDGPLASCAIMYDVKNTLATFASFQKAISDKNYICSVFINPRIEFPEFHITHAVLPMASTSHQTLRSRQIGERIITFHLTDVTRPLSNTVYCAVFITVKLTF